MAVCSSTDTPVLVSCSMSLTEIIQGVVANADGCLFTYGHSNLGKVFQESNKNNSVCGRECQWLYVHLQVSCSVSITEIIQGVVVGADGCMFTYRYSKLGKLFRESNRSNSGCGIRC